jgi:hypothetical protein
MSIPKVQPRTKVTVTQDNSRRSFFKRLISIIGGASSYWISLGTARSLTQLTNGILMPDQYLPPGYPKPTYVPPGYRLGMTFTGRLDGFRGGEDEVTFWYVNPRPGDPVFRQFLSVFVSPVATTPFQGTEDHSFQSIAITSEPDEIMQARYYDGTWVVKKEQGQRPTHDGKFWYHWDTKFNSLVFQLRGFYIGLRGLRVDGVGLEELIKVARSFKFE